MATKVRKQIYIDAEQEAALKRLAKDKGISGAEIIRQAIDRYAQSLPSPDAISVHGNGSERGFSV